MLDRCPCSRGGWQSDGYLMIIVSLPAVSLTSAYAAPSSKDPVRKGPLGL
jgi:hypothetical protein